ncbi:MAG TPA: RNA polymerase sigma factor [Acidimicrobiales bacterium]|jgi:RNA polymerase sigma-70 factor (ECF subfamily)
MDQVDDAAVIASSLREPAAFGVLFDRHATVLHRYLVRRLGPSEADGLVGEVFRIAFERRASYDGQRPNARPWLYGIATNLVAKQRRREARRLHATARLAASHLEPVEEAAAVAGAVDASRRWAGVAEAVANLPQGERDALVLYAWEGLGYDQVAAALDIPVGTVRSRLNRARRRLRELEGARGEGLHDDAPDAGAGGSTRG